MRDNDSLRATLLEEEIPNSTVDRIYAGTSGCLRVELPSWIGPSNAQASHKREI